jgi:hypothetical protein
MTRLRFSIAQLMAVVVLVAFGFAALRNANAIWAGATFSLAIISVSVAFGGACARKEGARMPWAGFATAGGIRLAIWLSTPGTVGSLNGPPRPLLYGLQGYLNPSASGGGPFIAYVQISNSLNVIVLGLIAAVLCRFLAVGPDRRNP